jgi:8-oxo-dGTP pyrophosphatase MutT (NUDIX family)
MVTRDRAKRVVGRINKEAMRTSQVAYVVVRLLVRGEDFFLLRAHKKWGDFSLVGGHVEPHEAGNWFAAARREAEEELAPLKNRVDFALEPIALAPSHWGPLASRSAGGDLTNYEAAWFVLSFLRDPVTCLKALPNDEFMLVDRKLALASPTDGEVTTLLKRLDAVLPGGLDAIPLAWAESIPEESVPIRLRRASSPWGNRVVRVG